MQNPPLIEICVNSAPSALEAQQGGADRVELCENLFEGGTTPSAGSITVARRHLQIGLMVIIRPRGGDFLYTDLEFEIMKQDIRMAKELGADGVVLGLLTPDGHVDVPRTQELVELASPLSVTFHRAFDVTADPFRALETLIDLGIDRILTSGQERTAFEGAPLIAKLVQQAAGRISLMPGSGVNERNIRTILEQTRVHEVHMTAMKKVSSQMVYRNTAVSMGSTVTLPEYELTLSDAAKVSRIRAAADAPGSPLP